ncbi:hypothetical protein GCM10028832_05820 [Streptomyces sparsus]
MQVQMGFRQQPDVTLVTAGGTNTLHPKILPHPAAARKPLFPNLKRLSTKEHPPEQADGRPEHSGRPSVPYAVPPQSRASASSFWSRETPSARSSSPSA